MQVFLDQVNLARSGLGGVLERVLDDVLELVDQVPDVIDEGDAAEDHLGVGDDAAVVGGDRGDDDEDAVGRDLAAVAQGNVVGLADVDAVDEDDARVGVLAEAGAAGVDFERQAVAAPENALGIDADGMGELRVQAEPLVSRRGLAGRSVAWSG